VWRGKVAKIATGVRMPPAIFPRKMAIFPRNQAIVPRHTTPETTLAEPTAASDQVGTSRA
jgi:hypothetical protein